VAGGGEANGFRGLRGGADRVEAIGAASNPKSPNPEFAFATTGAGAGVEPNPPPPPHGSNEDAEAAAPLPPTFVRLFV
jgi:hypothetical protein